MARNRKVLVLGFMLLLAALAAPLLSQDKPRIAVLAFQTKSGTSWYSWWVGGGGGAEAAQDVFVTELVKTGKFRVIEREMLAQLLEEKNLSLSGDVSAATAVKAGQLLGVKYFLTGALTEFGIEDTGGHAPSIGGLPSFGGKKRTASAAMNARIIDTETGEIVWADEARQKDSKFKGQVGGFSGGQEDYQMFDQLLKPTIQSLVASILAADI
jgi:curli biogenesis system outer membrane secretion channel CsgG